MTEGNGKDLVHRHMRILIITRRKILEETKNGVPAPGGRADLLRAGRR